MEIIFPTHFCAVRKITAEKYSESWDKNNKGKFGTKKEKRVGTKITKGVRDK